MKQTRRLFLKTSGYSFIGLIGLVSTPNHIFGANQSFPGSSDALGLLTAESFRQLIGSKFTFYVNDEAFESELVNVKTSVFQMKSSFRQKRAKSETESKNFRLIFRAPSDIFAQDNYQIFHPSIGLFNLMLVPGLSEKGFSTLTAVVNRL